MTEAKEIIRGLKESDLKKRNMDLIRDLLLAVEGATIPDMGKWSEQQRIYNTAYILDAGLALGEVAEDASGHPAEAVLTRLTWDGCEFLDAMRDVTVWNKVKENVLGPAASWTFPLVIEYAKTEIRTRLGL